MKSCYSGITDYEVGRTLGEGTFGKVKLAYHKKVQEAVAVKILYKTRITEPADVERITREIAILKAVNHPGIVRLFEIIESREEIFLVMEYASGGDLVSYIRAKKQLSEPEAARIFMEIVSAAEYIHSIGVAHRDLKPSNILLTGELKIKLADFGLSNMYRQGTKLTSPCGSPCYAAPEVIEGKAYQPSAADVWSMGVVLFMMLSGHLPYQHKNTHSLYKLILNARYEIPKGMSRLAADLIQSMFRINPARRVRLSEMKQHPWFKLHLGETEVPRPLPNKLPINDKVLQILSHEGYKIDSVLEELKRNKHGSLSTLYHLYCLKSEDQLAELVAAFQRVNSSRPQRMMSIDVRNPAEASHSVRKLFRRTARNEPIKKSVSREKSSAYNGTYMKMLKTTSNNNVSLNSTLSFSSSINNRTMESTQQSKFNEDSKKSTQPKAWFSTTTSIPSKSIEKHNKESKKSIKRRSSFIVRNKQEHELDIYSGPFNLECVFTLDPQDLKQRVINYARMNNISYREVDKWLMELHATETEQLTVLLNRPWKTNEAVLLRFGTEGLSITARKLLAHLQTTLQ